MFLATDVFFLSSGHRTTMVRTDKNSILWFSFRLHLKSHPQSEDYAPRHNHQFLKQYIFACFGTGEEHFPGLSSLTFYSSVASYSFYWPPWWSAANSSSTTLSCTSFWIFYPVEFNQAKKATLEGTAWTTHSNLSSLSLFSFSELNKALDTNKYNWWRVLIFW